MSRRDDRGSDARRHRSRFDRDPSPKRSKRDDHNLERGSPKRSRRDDIKLECERPPADTKLDKDRDSDMKHRRGLQDPLPLESPLAVNSKVEIGTVSKVADSRTDGPPGGTKKSSEQTNVPHSRSYLQHDDRASVGQNGRSLGRRTDKEDGWKDSKEHSNDRTEVKKALSDVRNDKPRGSRDDNRAWRHDRYHQIEAPQKPPTRKRPAFREHKEPSDPEKTEKIATDYVATQKTQAHAEESGKRDRDKRRFDSERSERTGRSFVREGELARTGARGTSRDKYDGIGGGGGRYRGGRERFNSGARQGYQRPGGAPVEKWKHDLYDDANKSPNPKNDEDQISKIEALLAS